MKKFIKLNIILLSLSFPMQAQFGVSGNFGFGRYAMQSLKDYNEFLKNLIYEQDNLQLNQLENFPVFRNFSFETWYENKKEFRVSADYQYLTTGSRLYNEDYSGKINYDFIVSANALHISLSQTIIKLALFKVGLFISPQVLLCRTICKSNLQIYPDYNQSDKTIGRSVNIGASGGSFIRKRLKKIEFSFEAGYYYDVIKGKLRGEYDGKKYDMKNPQTNLSLKNDWSGLRFSIGSGYFF
jgi:hypothetical protein